METILHITQRADWEAAQRSGQYRADSLASEGFIHCSKPGQILRVAGTFYAGQHGLALLVIDPARLKAELRWETPPEAAEPFPHVYGPINLEAVINVLDFEPAPDGKFVLPSLL